MKIKEWFQMMTLGQPYKYLRLMLWCLFDSIVMSIPYGLMLGAVYYLLAPLAQPGTALPTTALWLLVGGFLAQLIAYFFIRLKTYIDASTGYAGIIKDSQITLGEHLRQLSMGFYSARDAGDLSTVLLRDYQTVGDLSQQMLPQVAVILIRFVLAAVLLAAFDWRMTLAVFLVIPLALPFAFLSLRRMGRISADLQNAQREVASGILEYVSGIQTLRAFHMAGAQFQSLKRSFERERSAAIHMETGAAAPVSMLGRFVLSCGIGLVMLTGGVSADPRGVGALLLSGVFDPDTHYLRAGADPVYLYCGLLPHPPQRGAHPGAVPGEASAGAGGQPDPTGDGYYLRACLICLRGKRSAP